MSGPRVYTASTLKRLYALSGNQCAFQECPQVLVNINNAANSNICHIEAAQKGGERFNPNMTDEERADYHNLILLCPSHHKVTNDEKIYTVAKLKEMKAEHEAMIQRRVSATRPFNSKPSLLADVINQICSINIDKVDPDHQAHAFAIEAKIQYNHVIRYKPFIEEHRVYVGKLSKIYTEFEAAGKGSVNTVLRKTSLLYSLQKGKILGADTSLKNIRLHADDLIEAVERDLHDLIESSPNNNTKLSYEEVEFALSIILVDAFMRCKILEEPQ